jgi:hypothetical protein
VAAEPNPWPATAVRHSADTTAEADSRPITSALDGF